MIRFTRGSKQFAIPKGGYGRVEAVDRDANMLTINTEQCGRRIEYNPVRLFGVEVFREEQKYSYEATAYSSARPTGRSALPTANLRRSNPLILVRAVVRLDSGTQLSAASNRLRHIDHGYASTSHSAQGATVDRVIVDINTQLSPELVKPQQFYVSISRAREAESRFLRMTAPSLDTGRQSEPREIPGARPSRTAFAHRLHHTL